MGTLLALGLGPWILDPRSKYEMEFEDLSQWL